MSFSVQEFYESRRVNIGFEKQSAELMFVGYGSDDDVEARAGFLAVIPLTFFNLLFQDVDIEPVGGLLWKATAKYDSLVRTALPGQDGSDPTTSPTPPPPAPPDSTPIGPEFSFDISAVQEHITQSKLTISQTGINGRPVPDNNRAIGITQDGEVAGCDRMSPHFEWSTTRTFGFVTLGYFRSLYKLVGTVNDNTFYGFPSGECLFTGASLQSKQEENVTMVFKFACQPNQTFIEICPGLIVPSKKGWEYLWVSYKNVNDAGQLTQKPFYAFVEQIYDYGDFRKIGIGK
jgi:hypothetical protein